MIEDAPRSLIDNVTIEAMTMRDLKQVVAIERVSFRQPWLIEGFTTEMSRRPSVCLVVKKELDVLGYLIFWLIPPEIHLLNLAIRPNSRRQGLAGLLLDYMIEYGREMGVTEIFLEVRPSNQSALNLYHQLGFIQTGIRRNYYAADQEDAWLMTLTLGGSDKRSSD